ncbi:hypothetical protein RFM26_21075 [Mesorhizobium sp. VK23B]|uniref:Uncharacterized protein n=1 Tax=Mesorhizobium dulcispinae TaxID=3072316 RepID=A0ABU4XKG8_9HYPH|nr:MULTISPECIES: hypothetical protein [unclassified Mesorhizobium]MDX8468195.1 hypothetical protein [Mesorhizobium sp. VK23B]MDX8474533.1 hypothetical protein [Mesorhizobium sp. VK23A]
MDEDEIPPNRVTFKNIEEKANSLQELLTEPVFARLMRGHEKFADAEDLEARFRATNSVHPFVPAWYELLDSARRSREAGSMQVSEEATFLLGLQFALYRLSQSDHYKAILESLIDETQFFSTLFELFVFITYSFELQQHVTFVPVSTIKGERRPDLVFKSIDGAPVYLECKSMRDDVRVEQQVWLDIQAAIARKLKNSPLSLAVAISANSRLRPRDGDAIIDAASDVINNYPRLTRADTDEFTVRVNKILESDQHMEMPFEVRALDGADSMMNGGDYYQVNIDGVEKGFARKLWKIDTFTYPDTDQAERIVNLIKGASKQLPRDAPGIIHLQIPYRDPRHFQSVLDEVKSAVEGESSKRPHVCAIVITGRFLNKDKHRKAGSDPILSFHSVIPNYAASFVLPQDFRLLGSHPDMMIINENGFETPIEMGREGYLLTEFKPDSELSDHEGAHIVQYCSRDGRRQINIWQDFNKRARVEIWHEEAGHHTLDIDLSQIRLGKTNKALVTWNRRGISFVINGIEVIKSYGGDD